MCLYPILIPNPKYKSQPPPNGKVGFVPAGCGKCQECRMKYAKEWRIRLTKEIENGKKCYFVTLTFKDEGIPSERDEYNKFAKEEVRKFYKRWWKNEGEKMRYWLITELGQKNTERIHLHGLIWCEDPLKIEKNWGKGFVYIGEYVNQKTINYITKYITKMDEKHPEFKGKILASKGIGSCYINEYNIEYHKYRKGKTKEKIRLPNGTEVGMPMYYRKKIWTDEERELLWVEKIEKKKRYVMGETIDVSTKAGLKQYFECVEYHQRKNEEKNYGKREWKIKKYLEVYEKINKLAPR
ncbi:replication initiator protein [Sigmofec virus UA08Rod_5365]|uniref:Replication initiator protein n=1 Tax=Sigmofec virus UA08Rod_5365 TaxID=2929422 RepID=A0A976N286_9VIRU|nr:replication initiator protein [Sigmofec virus UA08Rod_5365]